MTSRNGYRRRNVLIDTGPLVAIFDPADSSHEQCLDVIAHLRSPAWTCWPVVTEAAYLLRRSPGGVHRLLDTIHRGDLIQLATLGVEDLLGISAYLARYADLRLQLADAYLAHLGDRDGRRALFTLDRRDFAALRLADGSAFDVLPT